MPVTINVNMMAMTHKGSNSICMAMIPDVCKTPSPAGPIPIPYPNISQSSDLAKGSTTVKGDGEAIAVKDSEYSKSNGDEAGTAGGVVSSVNMKEAKFILYSMDVKVDGKNVCRLMDKMTCNKQNTMSM